MSRPSEERPLAPGTSDTLKATVSQRKSASRPTVGRSISLSVVGAISAVMGQRLLARVSDFAVVIAALGAAGIVLLIIRRRGRPPGSAETMRQVLGIAIVGAVAGVGGERLYDRAPGLLLGAGVAVLIALLLLWRRSKSRGSAKAV